MSKASDRAYEQIRSRILSGDLIVRTSARLPPSGVVTLEDRQVYRPKEN